MPATLGDPSGGATGPKPFAHTFGGFGNIQSINTATNRITDTSPTTNRLTSAVEYDAAGNLISWSLLNQTGNFYRHDKLHQMTQVHDSESIRLDRRSDSGSVDRWEGSSENPV